MNQVIRVYFFLALIIIIVIGFNILVIFNKGFMVRMPDIIKKASKIDPIWNEIKDKNGISCNEKKFGCFFNKNSKKNIFILGDSTIAALLEDLILEINKYDQYNIHTLTQGGCPFLIGFGFQDKKNKDISSCNFDYIQNAINKINKYNNSIVIYGAAYNIYLNEYLSFKKKDRVIKKEITTIPVSNGKFKTIKISLFETIKSLSANNKVILIYPIPEIGYNVKNALLNKYLRNKKKSNMIDIDDQITVSYDFYKIKQKEAFEILDSVKNKNIYRVYPHEVFCNNLIKNKCVTHDKKNIFFYDGFHLSNTGSKMVNKLILDKIKLIENIN